MYQLTNSLELNIFCTVIYIKNIVIRSYYFYLKSSNYPFHTVCFLQSLCFFLTCHFSVLAVPRLNISSPWGFVKTEISRPSSCRVLYLLGLEKSQRICKFPSDSELLVLENFVLRIPMIKSLVPANFLLSRLPEAFSDLSRLMLPSS